MALPSFPIPAPPSLASSTPVASAASSSLVIHPNLLPYHRFSALECVAMGGGALVCTVQSLEASCEGTTLPGGWSRSAS
ncbi:hypothetical protein E2562_020037 [Oryza meyeriana var. granulata]|uniref:Uncharacterized protein n=1 Tax=Oryza meyeriana var. granulata TaxID=110450 RepID=A0A6G1FAF5_9ORYZ|nr:hypothetical protein E2562_020037 [Oryza meyeriana var. granulata]